MSVDADHLHRSSIRLARSKKVSFPRFRLLREPASARPRQGLNSPRRVRKSPSPQSALEALPAFTGRKQFKRRRFRGLNRVRFFAAPAGQRRQARCRHREVSKRAYEQQLERGDWSAQGHHRGALLALPPSGDLHARPICAAGPAFSWVADQAERGGEWFAALSTTLDTARLTQRCLRSHRGRPGTGWGLDWDGPALLFQVSALASYGRGHWPGLRSSGTLSLPLPAGEMLADFLSGPPRRMVGPIRSLAAAVPADLGYKDGRQPSLAACGWRGAACMA